MEFKGGRKLGGAVLGRLGYASVTNQLRNLSVLLYKSLQCACQVSKAAHFKQ